MTEMNLGKRQVSLDVSGIGQGSIVVDGVDMSNVVMGVDVRTQVGEATLVVLRLPAPLIVARLADADVTAIFADALNEDEE